MTDVIPINEFNHCWNIILNKIDLISKLNLIVNKDE